MRGQTGIQMAAIIDDVIEQGVTAVLHMAQVRRRLAPGQVPVEGVGQIQAQNAGSYESNVVDAQGTRVLNDLGS
jgi:hypothetical protein